MAERFEDIYEFNLRGNFRSELDALERGIAQARTGFRQLATAIGQSGARFSATENDFRAASNNLRDLGLAGREAAEVVPIQRSLASSAKTLAVAYNQLVDETNKLAVSRNKDQQALEQERRNANPRIIQIRAETRALRTLARSLEDTATQQQIRSQAAALGIPLTGKLARAAGQQATAEERAAAAIDKANTALATRNLLAAQGRDSTGNLQTQGPPAPLSLGGKLTGLGEARAKELADQEKERALLKQKSRELLKNDKAYQGLQDQVRKTRTEITALNASGKETESTFNRVSFTFRRLIGIMAVFTVARTVVNSFRNMITGAIEFNAQIETGRVGLAGLIAAAGEVRSPTGAQLGLDDQVLEAQNIAIDQMNRLRKDALETAASYDELSRAFNSAVAPGIQAGLTLDQIRAVTVDISQAATGLGLSQDQLAEEIRSLFSGTISARNTRIATALGISNQDIANAKKLGDLFGFLEGRFAAISKTGKLLLNTFTGQLSNASDAFKQLLATSSQPLFEQLKASLRDIQGAIFETTKDAVVFDPKILQAFTGLFEGLANGVRGIRAAFATIDIEGFAGTLAAIGQALGAVGASIAAAFTTFFNVASPTLQSLAFIFEVFVKLGSAVRSASGFLGSFTSGVLLSVAKTAVLFLTFRKILTVLAVMKTRLLVNLGLIVASDVATKAAAFSMQNLARVAQLAVGALKKIALPLVVIAAAVAAIDGLLAAFGSDFRVSTFIGNMFETLTSGLDGVIGKIEGVREELTNPVKDPLGIASNDFRELKANLNELVEGSKKSLIDLKNQLNATVSTIGLPAPIAEQASLRITEIGALFNSDTVRAAQVQIEDLDKKIKELQDRISSEDFVGDKPVLVDRQVRATEKFLSVTRDLTKAQEELAFKEDSLSFTNLLTAQSKVVELLKQQRDALKNRDEADSDLAQLTQSENLLTTALEKQLDLRKEIVAAEKEKNKEIAVGFTKIANLDIPETEFRTADLAPLIVESIALVARLTSLSEVETDLIKKKADAEKLRLTSLKQETELRSGLETLEKQIATLSAQDSEEAAVAAARGRVQLSFRQEELRLIEASNKIKKESLDLELRLAEARVSGGFGQGVGTGLSQFAAENDSIFNVGDRFGKDIANGITEFGGTAIKQSVAAAFDPNQNFDLRENAGNFLLDLGAGLATDLLKNLLSQLLTTIGVNLASSLGGLSAGAAAITTSAGVLTSAGTSVATGIGTAGGALSTLINGLILNLNATAARLQGQQATTTTVSTVAAIGSAKGGKITGPGRLRLPNIARSHANAQGFARGGRPLGIDPRDTIPAFLRPNEWVIRPEAAALYGDRIMDLINRMKISPAALRNLTSDMGGSRKMPLPKRGFATGGPVVSSAGGRRLTSPVGQVLQFNDEQTMDRALAAGPDSMLRFARARRGAYRAAMGFDAGS